MVTEEELKKMSPEEIMEFQKKNCIFCQIVDGKIQSKKIFEDDKCIAILDIHPANPGHILLIPKNHYSIMPQVPQEELSHMFLVVRKLSKMVLKVLKAEGTNIFIANGTAAGQKAQHFMIHLIPRKEDDGLCYLSPKRKKLTEDDIKEIFEKLIKNQPKGIEPQTEKILQQKDKESDVALDDIAELLK